MAVVGDGDGAFAGVEVFVGVDAQRAVDGGEEVRDRDGFLEDDFAQFIGDPHRAAIAQAAAQSIEPVIVAHDVGEPLSQQQVLSNAPAVQDVYLDVTKLRGGET